MNCIFCEEEGLQSREHIVPESMGNNDYVVNSSLGTVCASCNNRFSKFEDKVLSGTFMGAERARLASKTKKGKPSKANIGKISISGSSDFQKNLVTFEGITTDDITEVDPKTGEFKFVLKNSYEKREVPLSKLLLKIGFESIYNDRQDIFDKYDFSELRNFLCAKVNNDWPFIIPKSGKEINPMRNLLSSKSLARKNLDKIECKLLYYELDEKTLLFRFQYGVFSGIINLINRDTDWIEKYKNVGFVDEVLPTHFNK